MIKIKTSCKILRKLCCRGIQVVLICLALLSFSHAASRNLHGFLTENTVAGLHLPNSIACTSKAQGGSWPTHYIDSTINYGLGLVLPQALRKGLQFQAGYDRWEGLPTVHADYFLPLKAWADKSIFFSPRVSLSPTRESFSVGAGFRHLITSEALVGFHAFHDWTRPRRFGGEFLRQAGVGLELSILPGYFSDVSLGVNAYLPVNRRSTVSPDSRLLIEESLPAGGDIRLSILLPPLLSWADLRLDSTGHSYFGQKTNTAGFNLRGSLSARNGLFYFSAEHGKDELGEAFSRFSGGVSLAIDWEQLLQGNNPFSAPYVISSTRYNRRIRDSLYERVTRKHDLQADRTEKEIALAAIVCDGTVSFRGAFPDLPNSRVTVQVSRSPWEDCMEVITDSKGLYNGKLALSPGRCKIRLIHKPSGRVSDTTTVIIGSGGTFQ